MFLSAVSVLVVAQSSSEIPEGLMNNPALLNTVVRMWIGNQPFSVLPLIHGNTCTSQEDTNLYSGVKQYSNR